MNTTVKSRITAILIIFFILIASIAAAANAFNPEAYDELNEAEELLTALKIFNTPDSEFVTRREFAGMLVKLLAADDMANTEYDVAKFIDVKKEDALYNEIHYLRSIGVLSGFGGNVFKPEQFITLNDASLTLTSALGYKNLYNENNDNVLQNLRMNAQREMQKGIESSEDGYINSEACIRLLFKAIKMPMFQNKSYGVSREYITSNDYSVLSKYHSVYKAEGIVGAVYGASIVNDITCRKEMIYIEGEYYDSYKTGYNDYFGMKTAFYYKQEEGSDTKELVCMVRHKDVNVLTISSEEMHDYKNREISYFSENTNQLQTAKVNINNDIIINGAVREAKESDFQIQNGQIIMVDNDNDSEYEVVFINTYVNYIVSSVTMENDLLILKSKHIEFLEIDIGESDVKIYSDDGTEMQLADIYSIPDNTVISVFAAETEMLGDRIIASDGGDGYKLIVSSGKCEGVIESISYESDEISSVYIGGTEYKASVSNYLSETKDIKVGSKVSMYLDYNGEIVCWEKTISDEAEDDSFRYGYLVNAAADNSLNDCINMKIFTSEGEMIKYSSVNKVLLNNFKVSKDDAISQLKYSASLLNESNTSFTIERTISQLIKYRVNKDGKVCELQTITASVGVAPEYDDEHFQRDCTPVKMKVNSFSYAMKPSIDKYMRYWQAGVYFKVPMTETDDDDAYSIASRRKKYVVSSEQRYIDVYDVSDFGTPAVAVLYEDFSYQQMVTTTNPFPVMIIKTSKIIDDEGMTTSELICSTGIAIKTYYGNSENTFDGFVPGDLVLLYGIQDTVYECKYHTCGGVEMSIKNVSEISLENTLQGTYVFNGINNDVSFAEVFYNEGRYLNLQYGSLLGNSDYAGERSNRFLYFFTSSAASNQGGAILYDAKGSNGKPIVRIALPTDIMSVVNNGADKASKILITSYASDSRQLVIYNGI